MELEDIHENLVIKRHNFIEFGLVWFVLTSTLVVSNQGLMMELEDVYKNLVIKPHNSIELRLLWLILTSIFVLDRNQGKKLKEESTCKYKRVS